MTLVLGYLGLAGFLWLALFQTGLALGLPFGHLAWGGANRVLPAQLRWASLAVVPVAFLGALVVAQAADMGPDWLPDAWLRPLLIGFAALFALSFLGNAISQSRVERWHGVPLTLVLCLSCGGLAIWA